MIKGFRICTFLLSIILIVGNLSCGTTQSGNDSSDEGEITLIGTIVKKGWTKSSQSYCAQGSDYYVIQVTEDANKEYVIDAPDSQKLSKYANREVKCKGKLKVKIIEIKDDGGQHPVTMDNEYRCTVFKVSEISELDM